MEAKKSSILNRKPKQIRDKNFTFSNTEESKKDQELNYKEQKL